MAQKNQHGFRIKITAFLPYDKTKPATIGAAAEAVKNLSTPEGIEALTKVAGLVIESHGAQTGTRKVEE